MDAKVTAEEMAAWIGIEINSVVARLREDGLHPAVTEALNNRFVGLTAARDYILAAESQIAERDAQIAEKVRAIEVFAQITRSCLHWDEAPQECATPDAIYSSSISENSVVMRIDHLPFIIQKADAEGVERALHSVLAAILAPYFAPTAELGLTEAKKGELES
jgi:hypothetical protein